MMTMSKLAIGCVAAFLLGGLIARECDERAGPVLWKIHTNTLVQVRTQSRLLKVPTTPEGMAELLDEINGYRTAPGWIASSNGRAWAGLQARAWSAEYAVDYIPAIWQVGLWAGYGGAGAYVSRQVGPVRLGLLAGYGVVAGMAGVDW
jgi:hypothetical protein